MTTYLESLYVNSIALTPIALLYLLILKYLNKKYYAKTFHIFGVICMLFYIIPVRIFLKIPIFKTNNLNPNLSSQTKPLENQIVALSEKTGFNLNPFTNFDAFIAFMLIGTIVFLNFHIIKHICFLKYINRWKRKINDDIALEIAQNILNELNIKKCVEIYTCPGVCSPLVIGLLKSDIFLPENYEYDNDEMYFILKHEIIHIKHGDLWINYLLLIIQSLNWFNPIVFLLKKAIALQCEITCDEIIIKEQKCNINSKYGKCILKSYQNNFSSQISLFFASNFNSDKNLLYKRIYALTKFKQKKSSIIIPGLLCACLILCSANLKIESKYIKEWEINLRENITKYQQEPKSLTPEEFAPFLGTLRFNYTFYNLQNQVEDDRFFIGVSAYEAIVLKEIDIQDKSQLDELAYEILSRSLKAKETIDIGYTYTYTVNYPNQINNFNKDKYLL